MVTSPYSEEETKDLLRLRIDYRLPKHVYVSGIRCAGCSTVEFMDQLGFDIFLNYLYARGWRVFEGHNLTFCANCTKSQSVWIR